MAQSDRLIAVIQAIGTDIKALLARPVGGDAWTRVGLASDHVNGTTSFTDVPGWSIIIPANSNFTIECELLLAAVATTNLPRFGFNWNAAFAWAVGELMYDSSATAKVYANGVNLAAAGNLQMAAGTAPVAGGYGGRAYLKGRTGGAPVTIKAQLAAEAAAANAATLRRGSEFRSRVGP